MTQNNTQSESFIVCGIWNIILIRRQHYNIFHRYN